MSDGAEGGLGKGRLSEGRDENEEKGKRKSDKVEGWRRKGEERKGKREGKGKKRES